MRHTRTHMTRNTPAVRKTRKCACVVLEDVCVWSLHVCSTSCCLFSRARMAELPIMVNIVHVCAMLCMQASLLRLADRMPSWQLNVHTIDLCWKPSDADNLPDQAEAQCRMLRMLGLLAQPSNGTVVLSNWEYTFEALTVLAEALPGLGELSFTVRVGEPLTDELLGVVLGMGSRVQTLTCPSLALQSGQHANTPWPWEELRCTTLDVGQVCRLPDPAGTERGRGVVVDELVIGTSIDKVSFCCVMHGAWAQQCMQCIIRAPRRHAHVRAPYMGTAIHA